MSRLIALSLEEALAIRQAGRMCATLAAVEHAHMLGDDRELDVLLPSVDPIEARHTANILQALWRLYEVLPDTDRGGTTSDATDAAGGVLPSVAPAAAGGEGKPSAPVIPLNNAWSIKVPCN